MPQTDKPAGRVIRFGVFEVDLAARTLRKRGIRVRLQEQPFRLLIALLEKPGEIVTREEIKEKLWPDDTFVDFDKSLNTAAQKVRQALGDSAESPRFLETVPRQGYRWLAPVEAPAPVPPEPAPEAAPQPAPRKFNWKPFRTGAVVLATMGLVGLGYWLARSEPAASGRTRKYVLQVPGSNPRGASLSPDGRYVAYIAGSQWHSALWVYDFSRGAARELLARPDISSDRPAWSPDGSEIALGVGLRLMKVPIDGGDPVTLCSMANRVRRMSWSPNGGSIAFVALYPPKLFSVPATGGTPAELETDEAVASGYLEFTGSPREPRLLVTRHRVEALGPTRTLAAVETGEMLSLPQPIAGFTYSKSGHLVYQDGSAGALWAAAFDPSQMKIDGSPFRIAERGSSPSVSSAGTLAYTEVFESGPEQLVWVDRAGNPVGPIGQPQQRIRLPELSPDETEVVVTAVDLDQAPPNELWVHDANRPVKRQLTVLPQNAGDPRWSPSGTVAFASRGDIFEIDAGGGEPRPLLATPTVENPLDWSRDGRYLIVRSNSVDICFLRRQPNGEIGPVEDFIPGAEYDQLPAKLSPDSRYLAWPSRETGDYEIYGQPFPEGGKKTQVTFNGGRQVRWRRDGKELYFVRGDTLMALPVSTAPEFSFGEPQELFTKPGAFDTRGANYDVSADGERFVIVQPVEERASSAIRIVENWYEEFRDRGK